MTCTVLCHEIASIFSYSPTGTIKIMEFFCPNYQQISALYIGPITEDDNNTLNLLNLNLPLINRVVEKKVCC